LQFVDYEVRAGLSTSYNVEGKGWVADDLHSESASRTLDYACKSYRKPVPTFLFLLDDDYAAHVLAKELGKPEANFLLERSQRAPFTLWNEKTGFFEARNADDTWAGEDRGWTEGKFNQFTRRRLTVVYQVINGLIRLMLCTIFLN